ncbi:hypothetical protein PG993_012417 [Apiospora rasikravindrae]|uniref:Uncharacterized protein n=1 Tax=Apiospora rasikravindrae TaxID=990691 RepID=A0ABR1S458_9PEZI
MEGIEMQHYAAQQGATNSVSPLSATLQGPITANQPTRHTNSEVSPSSQASISNASTHPAYPDQEIDSTASVAVGEPSRPVSKAKYTQAPRLKDNRSLLLDPRGNFWRYESASLLLAIAAFVTIVVLLASYNGRERPDWPALININTLLSVLTAILKSSLLFPIAECIGELKWVHFKDPHPVRDFARWDAATRGPWGSLLLIFKHPLHILGALGAILTIVSLAIDPFAQQVLGFHSCLEPVEGANVTVPRTNNYTRGDIQYSLGTPSVDGPMTAALYSGLLNPRKTHPR